MPFLAQILHFWVLLAAENGAGSGGAIDEQTKREVSAAGLETAIKIIVVLLLFLVMMAMRSLNRRRLERSRRRRVKPWEQNEKAP